MNSIPPHARNQDQIQAGRFRSRVPWKPPPSPLSSSLLKQQPFPLAQDRHRCCISCLSSSRSSSFVRSQLWQLQDQEKKKPLAMVEASGQRSTASTAGFFRVPDLFVRLSSKGLSNNNGVDPDFSSSVWSPTSPLDSSRSLLRSSPPRVGLGLVDALTADATSLLFGGKASSSFLDSIRPFLELGGLTKPPAAVAAKAKAAPGEVARGHHADSEEYTCVIARGANPRTTHILGGGETLQVRGGGGAAPGPAGAGRGRVTFTVEPFADRPSAAPKAGVASGRCRCCMRRLPEDRDIFIYKGEKAFCSSVCREGYIEEEVEDAKEDLTALDHVSSSTAFFLGEDW